MIVTSVECLFGWYSLVFHSLILTMGAEQSRSPHMTDYMVFVVLPYLSNLNLVHWIPGNLAIMNFCSLLFDCFS
jgi:hypothetical protein